LKASQAVQGSGFGFLPAAAAPSAATSPFTPEQSKTTAAGSG
jgi:hypothetical protein